jgi:copper homeostasis protein
MCSDVPRLREQGADGVVFGILHEDGRLDLDRMAELVRLADGMRVVCHRAFDATPDADEALEQLISLGVHEVLTSGHAPTALEGAAVLKRHVQRAAGRILILAGGGVRPHNVKQLLTQTGVHRVHARATDARIIGGIRASTSP